MALNSYKGNKWSRVTSLILTPNLSIKQGGTGVIQLQSSVAFACADTSAKDPNCVLKIQMYDNIDSYDCTGTSLSVVGSEQCGIEIHGSSYLEAQENKFYREIVNMTITTKDVYDFNLNRNVFILALTTQKATSANKIMGDNYLGDVT
ncbi:hypothetical protein CHS0354_004236, partial [Potamilus streckersoni]